MQAALTLQLAGAVAPRAVVARRPARRLVVSAAQTQWDGEGRDYTMKDVEALHDEMTGKARQAGVFNGEGPDFDMKEVEAFHEAHKPAAPAGPDPSQYNGEGPDWDMRSAEKLHEEHAKDKAMRRK